MVTVAGAVFLALLVIAVAVIRNDRIGSRIGSWVRLSLIISIAIVVPPLLLSLLMGW